jgi:hypothetical protein
MGHTMRVLFAVSVTAAVAISAYFAIRFVVGFHA